MYLDGFTRFRYAKQSNIYKCISLMRKLGKDTLSLVGLYEEQRGIVLRFRLSIARVNIIVRLFCAYYVALPHFVGE